MDLDWEVVKTDSGIELKSHKGRMSWVPDRVVFNKLDDPVLRFEQVRQAWPSGTHEIAAYLDRLGVPMDASVRVSTDALRAAEIKKANALIRAAVRYRKGVAEMRAESLSEVSLSVPGTPPAPASGHAFGHTDQKALEIGTGTSGAHSGTPPAAGRGTVAPLYGGTPVTAQDSESAYGSQSEPFERTGKTHYTPPGGVRDNVVNHTGNRSRLCNRCRDPWLGLGGVCDACLDGAA